MSIFKNSVGDTIVEVLIAITVASTVLGGSYTVVNRTMANSRQAQEHGEALQIANKQVEYLASIAGTSGAGELYDGTPRFKCIHKDTGALVDQSSLLQVSDDASKYNVACRDSGPIQYLYAFEYVATGRFFKVYVTWPSVTGNGNDQVSLVYRPYRP